MQPQTRTQTAMGAAFAKVGLRPEDIEFDRAIALYLNNGGTIARAHERIDRAAEHLPEGHIENADNDQLERADRQTNLPQGGHCSDADNGHSLCAAERETSLLGEGHRPTADGHAERALSQQPEADGQGQKSLADGHNVDAPPVRDPSEGQVVAMAKVRAEMAKSIFDRVKTSTGRAWGNVNYRDLDELAGDGQFAVMLKNYIGSIRGNERYKTIRELITPLQFHALLRKAGKVPNEQ